MNSRSVFFLMVLLHIISDFHIQGCMSNLKQKSYWPDNPLYKEDYLCALFIHGLEWAITIMLPILYIHGFDMTSNMAITILIHAILHAAIDHAKCNVFVINLVTDQILHLAQIILIHMAFAYV